MKILNKKALHNYHILEQLEAGIVLSGAEVKSIRAGRLDLGESHVRILNGEVFLIDAQKSRKLLLHKHEIDSLMGKTSGKGTTLVPVSMYEKNNRFKVSVGLAKSKKEFDHRKSIKEKDQNRRIEQELRGKE